MKQKEFTLDLGGRQITANFNDIADQTNGSVMLSCDNTVVFATAVMGKDDGHNPGYFNLTVEYAEKYYAVGDLLGNRYQKREGRPSDPAVLASRVIDRTLRPLFDQHIKNAVQVIVSVLSVGNFDPVVLSVNAASLALATSDIPWNGPVGCVALRAGHDEGTRAVELNRYIRDDAHPDDEYFVDLLVCGREQTINMIEASGFQISDEETAQYLEESMKHITTLEQWQKEIVNDIGKEKIVIKKPEVPAAIKTLFAEKMDAEMREGLFGPDSKARIDNYALAWREHVDALYPNDDKTEVEYRAQASHYFHDMVDVIIHDAALNEDKRADLRAMDEVRDIYAQAGGISPLLHGTGIFYRGGTHVMSFLTLGGPDDRITEESMTDRGFRRYYHHYNFPPFSAGETGRVGGFNRRAIGHGYLAEKALIPVLPPVEEFPYTMRVVSESMASNGSTSQASICGSTLALMDGGVPIKAPVAGIAMGLMADPNDSTNYKILTDIQGPEDHHGDMDFKVAGTRDGITAIQLDIKVDGVPVPILVEALAAAKKARLHILDAMEFAIKEPRPEINVHAPKIISLKINEDDIGAVIGKGGERIQNLQEETQTIITIEDDGTIFITGKGDGPQRAKESIEVVTRDWEVGDMTTGKVIKIIEAGAIVALTPYHDGLVHISEIASFRVGKVDAVLSVGMEVPVVVTKVDKDKDRISLSIEKAKPGFIKEPGK